MTEPKDTTQPLSYANEWLKELPLDRLNPKLHGGLRSDDELLTRAREFVSAFLDFGNIAERLPSFPRVLDIGSGVGWPMQAFLERLPSARITGLDVSKHLIVTAQKRLSEIGVSGCNFVHYEGRTFPFEDSTFDCIYAIAMLWHLPDVILWRLLREALRVLKPGGWLVCHFNRFDRFVREIDEQIAIQIEGAPGHHHYFRTPQTIARVLSDPEFGGRLIDIRTNDPRFFWTFASKGSGSIFRENALAEAVSATDNYIQAHLPAAR
jgi:SAM-dependent methyltransferase